MATITIEPSYGYVVLAAASTFILNSIHGFNTSKFRSAAAVKYPAAYAPSSRTDPEAFKFNCAQRAHANYTENQPSLLAALLLSGIRYPIAAAVMGAGWSISRYLYMVGYSSGKENGKGRHIGGTHNLFYLGLVGLTVWTGVEMVLGK